MNTIKTYDGYLTFDELTVEQAQNIQAIFESQNFRVTLDSNALEFEYQGRDQSDYVVQVFQKVAHIVNVADGEVRCQIDDDDWPDPKYKFFTIRDRILWVQTGEIVRGNQVKPTERIA